MKRLLVSALAVLATGAPAAHAAGSVTLTEAASKPFPERAFVLSLPEPRALSAADLEVRENGRRVLDLQVAPAAAGGGRSAAVLAIDASESMHSGAIDDAMAAARAFARNRPQQQALGVVFFSREPQVALVPTTDPAKIDAVLAKPPDLTKGTRIYDAAAAATKLLADARARTGAVVVLSDGADSGSATPPASVAQAAKDARVRIFGVGLRSRSYDSTALRDVASTGGGTYAEARSSQALEGLFDALGRRLGNEYLVTWRSRAAFGEDVSVTAVADGLPPVKAGYAVPNAPAPKAADPQLHEGPSGWGTSRAVVAVSLVVASLVGLFVFLLLRPRRQTVRERVRSFSGSLLDEDEDADPLEDGDGSALVASAEKGLSRLRWWPAFKEQVEIARLDVSPARIALGTIGATLVLCWLLVMAGRGIVASIALVGIPVVVRSLIRVRVERQRRAFADQLGDNLQNVAAAMRAGYSFGGALSAVCEDAPEPAKTEFERVVREGQLGVAPEKSLEDVARRMNNHEVEYVAVIATLQRDTGGNTAEVLDRIAGTIRERSELRRMIRTLTAQGRLGGVIVSSIPIALLAFISLINPEYLEPLFEEPMGRTLLVGGAMLMACGWLAIRKIIDIKV